MTETKPTAGPYAIAHERMILGGDSALIAECPASEVGNRESLANTKFIADAFNVLHETGMGPRQLAERLQFLKSKGLTVGLATEAGKEPYLTYVVKPGSELCDLATVNKLIDAESERDHLAERVKTLESERAAERSEFVNKLKYGIHLIEQLEMELKQYRPGSYNTARQLKDLIANLEGTQGA